MRNKEDLGEEVKSGAEASILLTNVQFQSAMIRIKGTLMEAFINCPCDKPEDMVEIRRKLQSLQWVEDELTNIVQTGTMSSKELEKHTNNH